MKNPLESRFGYQLRRASVTMMADLAARLGELGLTVTEASILVLIGANPGVIQTEIGRTLGIKRANMAPLIASLESRRLVQRQAADGRSQALNLTAQGGGMAAAADAIMRSHEAYFLRRLSKTALRQLSAQLAAIWDESEKV